MTSVTGLRHTNRLYRPCLSAYITIHVQRTRSETLVAASALSLSPILLPVRWVPSRPASGESLGENTMLQHANRAAGQAL